MPASHAVQSLERACDLLEIVVDAPDGVSLQTLGERAALKTTTAFNLARTLVRRVFCETESGERITRTLTPDDPDPTVETYPATTDGAWVVVEV